MVGLRPPPGDRRGEGEPDPHRDPAPVSVSPPPRVPPGPAASPAALPAAAPAPLRDPAAPACPGPDRAPAGRRAQRPPGKARGRQRIPAAGPGTGTAVSLRPGGTEGEPAARQPGSSCERSPAPRDTPGPRAGSAGNGERKPDPRAGVGTEDEVPRFNTSRPPPEAWLSTSWGSLRCVSISQPSRLPLAGTVLPAVAGAQASRYTADRAGACGFTKTVYF